MLVGCSGETLSKMSYILLRGKVEMNKDLVN